ncbi:MAG: transketolase [Ignavibacteria bacterium]|nr:transketolase [Ignavibacteria bacterium]
MTYEIFLKNLVKLDSRFIVITAENRAAIRNLPEEIGENFIDTGITEQTMIGMACGLALRGRIPVCHALASFLTMRAYEFIRTDVGIAGLPVKLVGYVPGFLSEANGPTHQAIEDISLMRVIPGMKIFCPSDEEDMLIGLEKVLTSSSPYYIRFNNLKPVVKHNTNFTEGKAEVISWGSDITVLTYGTLLRQAYEAMIILESEGLSVRLINLRTLKPIDEELIISSAEETKLIVSIEDHFLSGGLYSILGEMFLRHRLNIDVLPIALKGKWFKPLLIRELLEYEKFTGRDMAINILKFYQNCFDEIKIRSMI